MSDTYKAMHMMLEDDVTCVHTPPGFGTLAGNLYVGHMELIKTLMVEHARLVESGYQSAVRTALVAPAHMAVMQSAKALADAAAQNQDDMR